MSVKEYTITTQDMNLMNICNILEDSGILGYSILEHDGYYKGRLEKGLDIVIIDEGQEYSQTLLEAVCGTIKVMNKQDSVYLTIKHLNLTVV